MIYNRDNQFDKDIFTNLIDDKNNKAYINSRYEREIRLLYEKNMEVKNRREKFKDISGRYFMEDEKALNIFTHIFCEKNKEEYIQMELRKHREMEAINNTIKTKKIKPKMVNKKNLKIEVFEDALEKQNEFVDRVGYSHIFIDGAHKMQCNYPHCNLIFSNKYGVDKHIKTHSQISPFRCPLCLKYFSRGDNCKKHLRICMEKNLTANQNFLDKNKKF